MTAYVVRRRFGSLVLLPILLASSCVHNRPEAPAVPVGPSSVEVDSAYSYKTSASNGKEYGLVYVRFDWGDGDTSEWAGYGEAFEMSHSWRDGGVYAVRAQARDDRKEFSEWSEPLSVSAVVPPYPYRIVDSVEIIGAPLLDAQVTPNGSLVYTTNDWSGALSAVRTLDLQLVTRIPFNNGWGSLGQVVCSSVGDYVYGTWFRWDGVAVVRTADQVVVDSLMLDDNYITSEAISPDGHHLYLGAGDDPSFVLVAGSPDLTVEDTIALPSCESEITSMLVAPDGTFLYVVSYSELLAMRLSDQVLEWRTSRSGRSMPNALAVHPSGNPLYLVDGHYIVVRDAFTGALIDSIGVPYRAWSLDVSRDGAFLYVATGDFVGESESGVVAVARTSDNTLVRAVALPVIANDVTPSPDGQRLYVAGDNGKLYVLGR